MIEALLPLLLTVVIYYSAVMFYKKTGWKLFNPVLISDMTLILFLSSGIVNFSWYKPLLEFFSTPLAMAVVLLAVPLYTEKKTLKRHFIPIAVGVTTGVCTALVSIITLSKLFGLEGKVLRSLLAKSITTPMAIEATETVGGITSITILAVVFTGIIGGAFGPTLLHICKIENHIAKGVGIGTSSHALGTAAAVEVSDTATAASSVAMALTGVVTVITITLLKNLLL